MTSFVYARICQRSRRCFSIAIVDDSGIWGPDGGRLVYGFTTSHAAARAERVAQQLLRRHTANHGRTATVHPDSTADWSTP